MWCVVRESGSFKGKKDEETRKGKKKAKVNYNHNNNSLNKKRFKLDDEWPESIFHHV